VLPVDIFTTTGLELCFPNKEVTVVILSIINGLRTVGLDCKGNCTLQSIAFEITRENYYSNIWGNCLYHRPNTQVMTCWLLNVFIFHFHSSLCPWMIFLQMKDYKLHLLLFLSRKKKIHQCNYMKQNYDPSISNLISQKKFPSISEWEQCHKLITFLSAISFSSNFLMF
jgi:hypothetical protein